MTPINLYDCRPNCDMTKVIQRGRATWLCARCKRDVSMRVLYYTMALEYLEKLKEKQK